MRLLAIIAAVVGVLALAAAVTASDLGRRAARQAQVATSRQIAAQAVEALGQQPIDLSLLLAVETWRAMQGSGLGPIVEVDDVLRRTLAEAPELIVKGGGSAVAFSPNRHTFATGSPDSAQLWDASSGRELAVLQHGERRYDALAISAEEVLLGVTKVEHAVQV